MYGLPEEVGTSCNGAHDRGLDRRWRRCTQCGDADNPSAHIAIRPLDSDEWQDLGHTVGPVEITYAEEEVPEWVGPDYATLETALLYPRLACPACRLGLPHDC